MQLVGNQISPQPPNSILEAWLILNVLRIEDAASGASDYFCEYVCWSDTLREDGQTERSLFLTA